MAERPTLHPLCNTTIRDNLPQLRGQLPAEESVVRVKPAGKTVRKPTPILLTEECPTEAQVASLRDLMPHPEESLLAVSVATTRGFATVTFRYQGKQRSCTYSTDDIIRLGDAWAQHVVSTLTKPA